MTLRSAIRLLLLSATLLASCRWEGGWRGTVTERHGVRFVTNEGSGVDSGRLREELKTLWKVGPAFPGAPGQSAFTIAVWAEPDPSGHLFVLDYGDQKITKLTSDGRFETQFSGKGTEPGGLSKARRLAWVDGRLYVANRGNERIEVFGAAGEVFPPIKLPEVQAPGEIYFADQKFYVERRLVPDGYFLYAYGRDWRLQRQLIAADPVRDPAKTLRSHNTVCVAPDGLWIVYDLLNHIQKVGFNGRIVLETSRDLDWKFPKDDKGMVIPEILVHRACAVDPAGNLYLVYSNPEDWKRGNEVYKFGPDGRLRQKAFTLPIYNVTFMRFDREGNLYYSDGPTLTKARVERKEGS